MVIEPNEHDLSAALRALIEGQRIVVASERFVRWIRDSAPFYIDVDRTETGLWALEAR